MVTFIIEGTNVTPLRVLFPYDMSAGFRYQQDKLYSFVGIVFALHVCM